MKYIPIPIIAAVVLVGCSESQQSAPSPEAKPAEPVTKDSNADKELFDAVKSGDIEAVEKRIAAGADISGKDDTGATVLHHAAIRGRHEMIKILLKAGGDVNAKIRNNNTPLHMAILGGAKKDVLLALLEGGANVNAQGRWTPLDAVDYGRSRSSSWRDETIDLLRKHGGKTKEELQDPSAPIKKLNSTADLALFGAVMHNNVEAAKKALANGADVNARGIMATKNTPLIHAATVGAKEIVELLIANGADVNARYQGKTALLHTATYHKEIVELLIANGADVNAKIESGLFKGKTALDLAIKFNKPKTADLLRKHGGKTGEELKAEEQPTEPVAGVSALPSAPPAEAKSVKPVAEAKKLEPSTPKAPNLPIHYASRKGNIEVVRQQIAAGTDVNVKNNFGSTPLHHASGAGHREIVELLIIAGADVNGKMNNGITPLGAASFIHERTPDSKKTKNDIITLLRKHGAKTRAELKAEGK